MLRTRTTPFRQHLDTERNHRLLRSDCSLRRYQPTQKQRVAAQLADLWRGTIINARADGNCLVHSFCQHLEGEQTRRSAARERQSIVQHTIVHRHEHPFDVIPQYYESNQPLKYYFKKGKYLLMEHVIAWHQLRRITVILFSVHRDGNKVQVQIIDTNPDTTVSNDIVGLLQTNDPVEHYDYVALPQNRDTLKSLPGWNMQHFDI